MGQGGSGTPFTVRVLDSGVVHLWWTPGLQIDCGLAREAIAQVVALNTPSKRPLLVDMTGTARVTRPARQELAARCLVSRLALLGRSLVDQVIANSAFGMGSPAMPTRFFTNEDRALRWLLDHRGTQDGAGATDGRFGP